MHKQSSLGATRHGIGRVKELSASFPSGLLFLVLSFRFTSEGALAPTGRRPWQQPLRVYGNASHP